MFDQQPMQGYDGWGVNAPYMTPAYMSNFRPRYNQGDNGYNPYANNYSIGESLRTLGPGHVQYGADAYQTLGAHQYNVATGVSDAAAWGLQNVAIPAAAWYGADKMLSAGAGRFGGKGIASGLGSRMGRGAAGGAARMGTRAAGAVGMGGVASGLGRVGAGAAFRGGAAALGGVAGGMFLPLAAAQGVASVADSALVDPYVATRRGMDAMKSNTANTFISGAGGSASGGFGMSAVRAQEISQAVTEAGQRDFSMDGGQYNEIADNMMRSGMFSEIGDMDTDRIVDGVKKATGVLKLITRITGDPDIQAGIQTLAKLKAGGLDDVQEMGRVLEGIRSASAASGVSVNQLMDTVGNQGTVMAQQQGMRGVTGTVASIDAYAGFENARKAGLISNAQVQALGGTEGMTQNMMGGAMTMLNSGMGRMIMQGGGQFGGSMVGNISGWGGGFSADPFRSQGDWFANQGAYKDKAMNEVGAKNIMLESLKSMARSMGRDPKDGAVLASLAESQGLSPEQFRSMAEADRAAQDPLSRMRMAESRDTALKSDIASERLQEGVGMIGVPLIGDMQLGYRNMKSDFLGAGAEVMSPVTETLAEASDWWDEILVNSKGQLTDYQKSNIVESTGEDGKVSRESIKLVSKDNRYIGTNQRTGKKVNKLVKDPKHNALISKLNTLANSTATPESVKKDLDKAYKALADGDVEGAMAIFRDIESKNKGMISGYKEDYEDIEREEYLREMEATINSGELSAVSQKVNTERTGSDQEKISDMLTRATMSNSDIEDNKNIGILLNKEGVVDNEAVWAELGLDANKMRKLDTHGRKKAMKDAMLKRSEDDTDISGRDQLYDALESRGVSRDDAEEYISSTGDNIDTVLKEINSSTRSSSQEVDRMANKVNDYKENDPGKDVGSSTNWDFLKDVGTATEANTTATQALTEAIVAKYNQDKGTFADELTIQGLASRMNSNKV